LGFVLVGVGFVLMLAELFVPSGGALAALSLASLAVGIALTFFYDTYAGLWTLVGTFLAVPLFAVLMRYLWPRTKLGRQLVLAVPDAEDTLSAMPANQELEQLKGRIGRTLSALRPAGVVDFDGRRVDTVTEGMMVDPGQWVRCIDVRAGRVVVRPVERPNLRDLEEADFG
jgi:membrane-bound serine protease (ClpP class)